MGWLFATTDEVDRELAIRPSGRPQTSVWYKQILVLYVRGSPYVDLLLFCRAGFYRACFNKLYKHVGTSFTGITLGTNVEDFRNDNKLRLPTRSLPTATNSRVKFGNTKEMCAWLILTDRGIQMTTF